jgi:hypothetical protein
VAGLETKENQAVAPKLPDSSNLEARTKQPTNSSETSLRCEAAGDATQHGRNMEIHETKTEATGPVTSENDLLYGLAAIGRALGLSVIQTQYRVANGEFPTFRMGRIICASRSGITAWLVERGAREYRSNGA